MEVGGNTHPASLKPPSGSACCIASYGRRSHHLKSSLEVSWLSCWRYGLLPLGFLFCVFLGFPDSCNL